MMEIEAGGDMYAKIDGQWMRMTQDGGTSDYATKRESRLLDEIEALRKEIEKAAYGGG